MINTANRKAREMKARYPAAFPPSWRCRDCREVTQAPSFIAPGPPDYCPECGNPGTDFDEVA